MLPRYQIFVSSTFRDLSDERQAVQEAILELNHFPAGMETFPAADSTPWELIESIIEDSDYYILIIGGRYGSTGPEGISYTEMEYNLAVKLGKPILSFLHGAPDLIPVGKSELDTITRQKLDEFRKKVSSRHCKYWKNRDELKSQVIIAISHISRTKPAAGWIKNTSPSKQELLEQLNELQLKYDHLERSKALSNSSSQDQYKQSLEEINWEYPIKFYSEVTKEQIDYPVTIKDIFFGIGEKMLVPCAEAHIGTFLSKFIEDEISGTEISMQINRKVRIDKNDLQSILLHLMAADLIEPETQEEQHSFGARIITRTVKYWKLTSVGKKAFLKTVISRKDQ